MTVRYGVGFFTDATPWVKGELSRFTYKPGWILDAIDDGYSVYLTITFMTEDTHNPGRQIKIGMREPIPENILYRKSADHFAKWLQDRLFDVERHESREWLRRDGQIFDNPHN